jgi:hypothetical protein
VGGSSLSKFGVGMGMGMGMRQEVRRESQGAYMHASSLYVSVLVRIPWGSFYVLTRKPKRAYATGCEPSEQLEPRLTPREDELRVTVPRYSNL